MDMILASSGITEAIADIERRRLAENEAGMTLACSAALHRLQELLKHETEALRLRGPASAHLANVEAVSFEIERVRRVCAGKSAYSTRRSAKRPGDLEPGASADNRH